MTLWPHESLSPDAITQHMRATVDLALAEVERGGIPFAGTVVDPRLGVLGTGVNRVLADRDPAAHAEIVALRNAARTHPETVLRESVLFASGEPCGICYQAAIDNGVRSVLYAVGADQAADHGFDYRDSYARFGPADAHLVRLHHPVEGALQPFTEALRRRFF